MSSRLNEEVRRRTAAEAALRESEQRFHALLEQAPFSVQVFASDGRTLSVNRVWEELWGITRAEVAGYNVLTDPQLEAKGLRPHLARAFAGEPVRIPPIEYDPSETLPGLALGADPRRWVAAVAYPLKDSAGRVTEVVLLHDDITSRKRAEDALQESEEKFRLMADTIPQLAWMAREDGFIFWYNRRWYEYTGTTLQDMVGWGWTSVHDPQALPAVMENWRDSLQSGEPFDMVFPLRGADGLFRPFLTRVNPLRGEDGRVLYWFGTNTEITEQKRAESTSRFLADASAALSGLVDTQSTLETIASLSVPRFADWCFIDMVRSDASLRRLAIAHADPAQAPLADEVRRRFPLAADAPNGAPYVVRTGEAQLWETVSHELLVSLSTGGEHLEVLTRIGPRSALCVPMKARGQVIGALTFLTAGSGRLYGAADLVLAEELAARAAVALENAHLYAELREADSRKDEFLAMLAHELRNPLASIRTSLEIIKRPAANRDVFERAREIIDRQLQHVVRLVDDLLDVSRVMRGRIEIQIERLDLSRVIALAVETERHLFDTLGHELVVSLPKEPLFVDGDPVRLAQVVGNLLTNAAKYTERGGRIRIEAAPEGTLGVVRVVDNGLGIAPEMLSRIFELFVQVENSISRTHAGLGIGLTLARRLVELHGGRLEVHSGGLGSGSEFVVCLDLAPAAPAVLDLELGPGARPEPPRSVRRNVLVVDDNVDAAETLTQILSLDGSDVRMAFDGPSALQSVRERRPEVIFLDLGMPGMDGYEVARQLRQDPRHASLLLVALTGWGQEEDRRRSALAGFDLHLVKPIDFAEIKKALLHPKLPPL